MTIITTHDMLNHAMVISAMILACWLGNKKNRIIDVIAGVIAFFIVVWILIMYHVIHF